MWKLPLASIVAIHFWAASLDGQENPPSQQRHSPPKAGKTADKAEIEKLTRRLEENQKVMDENTKVMGDVKSLFGRITTQPEQTGSPKKAVQPDIYILQKFPNSAGNNAAYVYMPPDAATPIPVFGQWPDIDARDQLIEKQRKLIKLQETQINQLRADNEQLKKRVLILEKGRPGTPTPLRDKQPEQK